MAADQWIGFSGGFVNGDSVSTNNTYMRRDGNGDAQANVLTGLKGLVSGMGLNVAGLSITGTATIDKTATFLLLDATAGAFTATLPPAASCAGQFYVGIKVDSGGNLPTIKGNASETIFHQGGSGNTYTALSAQGKMALFYSDGTQWWAGLLT